MVKSPNLLDGEPGSLRDYFVARVPEAPKCWVDYQKTLDHNRNPFNEPHKPWVRDELEIRADFAFAWADALLKAREKGQG